MLQFKHIFTDDDASFYFCSFIEFDLVVSEIFLKAKQ